MADFVLQDDQNVTCTLPLVDAAGNAVPGETADAGTVVATGTDGGTNLALTVSSDQSTLNIRALGPDATGITVTVAASLGGVALTPGTLVVDVDPAPVVAVDIVPGTPVTN